ncbi:MAG TPA: hypothetical protein VKA09_02210 [Nitrososphaeraceae archaeon]|nr:hypothetical protein [Nitrososphaeraceae archaeon]
MLHFDIVRDIGQSTVHESDKEEWLTLEGGRGVVVGEEYKSR